MTITEEINKKIIEEYKSGNEQHRILLQTVKAELQSKSKDLKRELNSEEEIALMRREAKQRQDALNLYREGARDDLVEKMEQEIKALEAFLPAELSDEQIENEIVKIFSHAQDKSFGSIMKLAMPALKSKADGSRIAKIVKKITDS